MLHRLADLVRLRTYASTLIQPVGRVGQGVLHELPLGTRLRAQVEAALPDGTFRVTIGSQALVLRLPSGAQAGDVIGLSIAAREPRLKFAIAAEATSAAPAARLSETARFITALLNESEKLPVTGAAPSGTPLLDGAAADSTQVAAVLRRALTTSGMFYEAHQAQWVTGERGLADLMQEPQAQLPPLPRTAAMAAGADADGPYANPDAVPRMPELPVHRDALGIVRHQLETLDSRQVFWHGLVWQGQPVEWEVAEHPHAGKTAPEMPAWRTRVRLTLPRMGAVDATLLIAARGVAIMLHADSLETAAALDDNRAALRQALRTAGVNPLDITVQSDASGG